MIKVTQTEALLYKTIVKNDRSYGGSYTGGAVIYMDPRTAQYYILEDGDELNESYEKELERERNDFFNEENY